LCFPCLPRGSIGRTPIGRGFPTSIATEKSHHRGMGGGMIGRRWYEGVFGQGFMTLKDDDMKWFLNVGEDDTKGILNVGCRLQKFITKY